MKNKDLIEYLRQFPEDAEPFILVANPKERFRFEVMEVQCVLDEEVEHPLIGIIVGPAKNMEEDEVQACEEDEREMEG